MDALFLSARNYYKAFFIPQNLPKNLFFFTFFLNYQIHVSISKAEETKLSLKIKEERKKSASK